MPHARHVLPRCKLRQLERFAPKIENPLPGDRDSALPQRSGKGADTPIDQIRLFRLLPAASSGGDIGYCRLASAQKWGFRGRM